MQNSVFILKNICPFFAKNCFILAYFYIFEENLDRNTQMKAILEQLPSQASQSFLFRYLELQKFDGIFHFHPEYELTLILSGEGYRYVGGQVQVFEAGDLVFLGANLPHSWRSLAENEGQKHQAIVIQFREDFLGKDFFELPEMLKIKELFQNAKSGLAINGNLKEVLSVKIQDLTAENPTQKLLGLLDILQQMSVSDEIRKIDFSFSQHHYNKAEMQRFQQVFAFLIENYRREISLEEISQVANLAPTSFCRYFKNITQKTFVEVLHEFRLQFACHLLQKTEKSVYEIAFECGFKDIFYFHKTFKKHKNVSPLAFRRMLHSNLFAT